VRGPGAPRLFLLERCKAVNQLRDAASLGRYQRDVDAALRQLGAERVMERLWARDFALWKPEPAEITNRLGWLDIAQAMTLEVGSLQSFASQVLSAGFTQAVLLGMGGSSLAPEVYARTLAPRKALADSVLELTVLDSTDPAAVLSCAEGLDPKQTLFIVSTKSGSTVETLSLFKFFYNWTQAGLGAQDVGSHFVAITDPGSSLAALAARLRFRSIFLSDPNIGGRYSALSHFGLVPAALVGVDLPRLLQSALDAAASCAPGVDIAQNVGAYLGAVLGVLAKVGRDKVTFIVSPAIASFGDWVEQLIAESTGKEGQGILPVVGEPLAPPSWYGNDRLFVYLQLGSRARSCSAGPDAAETALVALESAGHPVLRLRLNDPYELGAQFFVWEMATAVASYFLRVNPFDQPNVESAKVLARQMLAQYEAQGALPAEKPALSSDGVQVYGDVSTQSLQDAFRSFLDQARPGAYISLQVYLQATREHHALLQELRLRLRERSHLATTLGFGPRFLHSTGQLHKGDAGRGLFIQITADDVRDVAIPNEPGSQASAVTFGVLKAAQALGDRQALLHAGRKVIRLHLSRDVAGGLEYLTKSLA